MDGGTGMCRVRRSVRPAEEAADGLPGEKTFGDTCFKTRVFPKSLTSARRTGETPSRAAPSRPMRQAHQKARHDMQASAVTYTKAPHRGASCYWQ